MADTKISALPASATPLTGSETLPIVQSGATKKVSVANLTAGRDVDMAKAKPTDNVVMAAGKGIDFSANGGDVLTQYDEGTWTPAFGAYTGAFISLTYAAQIGRYTRVGNQVTAYFSIVLTAVTTGTAADILLVTGLPFTPAYGTCVTTYQSNFATQGPDFGQFYGAGSNILLRSKTATSVANVPPSEVTNTTELTGSVIYYI